MKIVLDTNIFISALFWRGKQYQIVKEALNGKYKLVLTKEIIKELEDKLTNKFQFKQTNEYIKILKNAAEIIVTKSKVNISRDPKDNMIIEAAIDSKAKYIITGDKDLLIIKQVNNIKIVNVKQFLKI